MPAIEDSAKIGLSLRPARISDVGVLAEMNYRLICDEGRASPIALEMNRP